MMPDKGAIIKLLDLPGVAACAGSLDKSGALRIYLLEDTPELRKSILQLFGDCLLEEQIIFEPQKQEMRCSFCDKHRNEVILLVASPLSVIQGKLLTIYICNECIECCVELFKKQDNRPQ